MKLATARRRGLAAFVTVVSLAMASQALAQECRVPSGNPRPDDPALVPTINYVLGNANADARALRDALNACNAVLTRPGQRTSLQAQMCVSEAQLRLAKLGEDPTGNYAAASCGFQIADTLAGRGRRQSEQARAQGLRVEALLGLASVSGRDQAERLIAEADRAHSAATQSSPDVHWRLFEIYRERTDATRARREAEHLGDRGLRPALAWIGVARLDPAHAQESLERAYRAQGDSVAVNSDLGRVYFNRGEWVRAWDRLRFATGPGRTAEPGFENLQLDAFYYRSILESSGRGFGTLRDARDHADQAGVSQAALRQMCLVRLVLGGEDVYRAILDSNNRVIGSQPAESLNGYDRCNRMASTAEGQLLLGMFWLRRAQYMPASRPDDRAQWRAAVARAVSAFSTSRSMQGADRTALLNWPAPPQGAVTLAEMVDYGEQYARYAESGCQGTTPSDTPNQASAVFRYYHVNSCRPL